MKINWGGGLKGYCNLEAFYKTMPDTFKKYKYKTAIPYNENKTK